MLILSTNIDIKRFNKKYSKNSLYIPKYNLTGLVMKKICSIDIINSLLFGCVLVGFTHSAFSQQQDSGFELEEIIVSARRIEENLQTTPAAVTALTGDELVEIRGAVKLTDITSFVPNVNLSPHGPTGGTNAFPSQTMFLPGYPFKVIIRMDLSK